MGALVADLDPAHARLHAHASVVGALAIVPLPWLPELGQVVARRRLVEAVAKAQGVVLGAPARRALAEALAPSESAMTGSLSKRFLAARVARRFKLLAVLPALEAAVALAAGAFLLDRAFDRCSAQGVAMSETEAKRTQKVVHAALESFTRPASMEEVLRQTGALDDGLSFVERVRRALRGVPAESLRVLEARFDDGWDSL